MVSLGKVTTGTVSGLRSGSTYYFSVTAVDALGLESPFSNETSYTVPNNISSSSTNTPPFISGVPDQTRNVNSGTGPLPFWVGDRETPGGALTVAAVSSNPTLVPGTSLNLTNNGTNWAISITPPAGQTGTATISLTVCDSSLCTTTNFVLTVLGLPTVVLTPPASSANYTAPATLPLTASVSANGHVITKVQFLNGTSVIGESAAAPYAFTWANVGAGTYSLSARVVFDAGSTAASPPVSVTVLAAPTVVLTLAASSANYTAPATLPLTASVSANGHVITKVQFLNGTSVIGESAAAPYAFTWANVGAGTYSLSARVVFDAGSTAASPPVSMTVIATSGLPAPWQTTTVGSPGVSGSATISNALFNVSGSGNISGSGDNFRFLYQPLSGDGEIRAQILSANNVGPGDLCGAMIRESLTPGSRYALMGYVPGTGMRWQRRSNTSSGTSSVKTSSGALPNSWVRLVRTGNSFSGYKSTDGVNWTLVSSSSITMAANIYVGFGVASGNTTTLTSCTLSKVIVVP